MSLFGFGFERMEYNIADLAEPLVPENAGAPFTGRALTDGVSPMERKRGGFRDK
jgi:hypothetical protein